MASKKTKKTSTKKSAAPATTKRKPTKAAPRSTKAAPRSTKPKVGKKTLTPKKRSSTQKLKVRREGAPVRRPGIPDGYRTVTPRLVLADASTAIQFYQRAFGAQVMSRIGEPGRIMHAALRIGDSMLHVNDDMQMNNGIASPQRSTAVCASIDLYVEDVDEAVARAIGAGAEMVMPVEDSFWGDRCGMIKDPFGHFWFIMTHVRDMTDEEVMAAAAAINSQPS